MWITIPALVSSLAPCMAWGDLVVSVQPVATEFMLGEPIPVRITYTNKGKEPIEIVWQYPPSGVRFWTEEPRATSRPYQEKVIPGALHTGPMNSTTIDAGSSRDVVVYLGHFVRFNSTGVNTVSYRMSPFILSGNALGQTQATSAEFRLRIQPRDEERLDQVLEECRERMAQAKGQKREEAAAALAYLPDEHFIQHVGALLKAVPYSEIARQALSRLRQTKGGPATVALVDALENANHMIVDAALGELTQRGAAIPERQLEMLAQHPVVDVRLRLVSHLQERKPKTSRELLRQLAYDPHETVSTRASAAVENVP